MKCTLLLLTLCTGVRYSNTALIAVINECVIDGSHILYDILGRNAATRLHGAHSSDVFHRIGTI